MRRELLELIVGMNNRNVELQLALQCAPVIAGLKASNLLILPRRELKQAEAILDASALSYSTLCNSNEKNIILVYEPSLLWNCLMKKRVRGFFRALGYEEWNLTEILQLLKEHFIAYKREEQAFPHEMGLLLGYPLSDVEAYIAKEGKDYLWNGYWKVYDDVERKKKLFARFELAKISMLYLLIDGEDIVTIINSYNASLTIVAL